MKLFRVRFTAAILAALLTAGMLPAAAYAAEPRDLTAAGYAAEPKDMTAVGGGQTTAGSEVSAAEDQAAAGEEQAVPQNPVYDAETDTATWSYVYFGSYPQKEITGDALTDEIIHAAYTDDVAVVNGEKYLRMTSGDACYSTQAVSESFYNWRDKTYAYFKYEPIRWRVLQNDGETLFLMADRILDVKQYCLNDGKVTWETSNARKWLNSYNSMVSSYGFLGTAFTEKEAAAIQTTHITASDNVFHGIDGGNDTDDKVFLLSIREAMNPAYGFSDDVISYTKTRRLEPSDYAFAMGNWLGTYNEDSYGSGFWLLRSPGSYLQAVSLVYPFGHVYQDGYYANEKCYGICPAIRVDIDSGLWSTEPRLPDYGDLDENERVDLEDAKAVLRRALRLEKSSENERLWSDVDGDGSLTLTDTRLVLQRALKVIDAFPVEAGREPAQPEEKEPCVYQYDELTWPKAQQTKASGTIWIAGDSIAATYSRKSGEQPRYGWGEMIGGYFDWAIVNNMALDGRSTKSFTAESNYTRIMNEMGTGDYLLISFGHNDERGALTLYDDPFGDTNVRNSFKWLLKTKYIDPALEKGVTPVLISPVVRRYFWQGEFLDPQLHAAYGKAMEELSEEYRAHGIEVPFIDLHSHMSALYHTLGEEGTGALHVLSGGNYDNTHLTKAGAEIVCEFITEQIRAQGLSLAEYLRKR